MDIGSLLGLIVGFGGILFGFLKESNFNMASLTTLFQVTAAAIVVGGTAGAIILNFPMDELKKLPAALKIIFHKSETDVVEIIKKLVEFAEKSRKEGLLSLEQEAQSNSNPLIRKGLSLVVDGIEPETVRDILDIDKELRAGMMEKTIKIFEAAGGYSPTMGVIGTVMGMVNILGNMGADTNELAKSIAVAFIATFYGVSLANLVYLPMAGKLKAKAEEAALVDDLVIEGLLSIQHGDNPRVIKEKLNLTLFEKIKGIKETEENSESAQQEK